MTDSSDRIVILSDTHLGKPGCGARSAEALRPLWRGASQLIINGDVAELADDKLRADAARQVVLLQRYCDEDGVTLTLLPGNHDPMISDVRHLRLCGGEVFVTHGDALHPSISPWTAHRDQLERFHSYAQFALGKTGDDQRLPPVEATLAAAQYAAHFTWDDWHWHPQHTSDLPRWLGWLPRPVRTKLEYGVKVARVLWYWHTLPRRASAFAERFAPEARFFVYGHIHRAGVWRLKGATERVLVNTGSYDFPSKPHAVVIEGGRLSVRRIVLRDGAFTIGPSIADFGLTPAAAPAAARAA